MGRKIFDPALQERVRPGIGPNVRAVASRPSHVSVVDVLFGADAEEADQPAARFHAAKVKLATA